MTFADDYADYLRSSAAIEEYTKSDDFADELIAFRDFVDDNDLRSAYRRHHLVSMSGPWGWVLEPEESTTDTAYVYRPTAKRTPDWFTIPLRWFTDNASMRDELLAEGVRDADAFQAKAAERKAEREREAAAKAAKDKAERRALLAGLLTEFADDLPEVDVRP